MCPYVRHRLTGIDDVTRVTMVTRTRLIQGTPTGLQWSGRREELLFKLLSGYKERRALRLFGTVFLFSLLPVFWTLSRCSTFVCQLSFFFTFSFLFKLLLWGTIFFWLDKKKKQKNPTLCKITILSHYAGLSVALLFRNGSRPHVSLLSLFILMYFNSAWCLCYSRHVTTGVVIMRW